MSSADIKIDLFRKIDRLNGESLKEAYGIFLNYVNGKTDINEWDELTQEQQEALIEGIQQLKNGEGRSHLEVMTHLRSRLLDA